MQDDRFRRIINTMKKLQTDYDNWLRVAACINLLENMESEYNAKAEGEKHTEG